MAMVVGTGPMQAMGHNTTIVEPRNTAPHVEAILAFAISVVCRVVARCSISSISVTTLSFAGKFDVVICKICILFAAYRVNKTLGE